MDHLHLEKMGKSLHFPSKFLEKKCRVRLFRSYEKGERMRKGHFSTCLRKCQVMTWSRTSSQPSIAKVIASGTLKSNSVAAK